MWLVESTVVKAVNVATFTSLLHSVFQHHLLRFIRTNAQHNFPLPGKVSVLLSKTEIFPKISSKLRFLHILQVAVQELSPDLWPHILFYIPSQSPLFCATSQWVIRHSCVCTSVEWKDFFFIQTKSFIKSFYIPQKYVLKSISVVYVSSFLFKSHSMSE